MLGVYSLVCPNPFQRFIGVELPLQSSWVLQVQEGKKCSPAFWLQTLIFVD